MVSARTHESSPVRYAAPKASASHVFRSSATSARLPYGEPEPLRDVSMRGGEQHQAIEPAVEEDAEQPPDLPVDPAHRAQHGSHPGIEGERIEDVDVRVERVDVVGNGLSHGAPVELGEDGAGLVGIG